MLGLVKHIEMSVENNFMTVYSPYFNSDTVKQFFI